MIKVIYQGVEIQCETADEAIDIASRLSGLPTTAKKSSPAVGDAVLNGSRWTGTRFQSFISELRDRQKKFLKELVNSPDGLTDAALRQTLGVQNNKGFGPIITGISRRAKKSGMSLQDILLSEKISLSSGERVLEFKAAPAFVRIATESGGVK